MVDEAVAEVDPLLPGNDRHQVPLDAFGAGLSRQAEAVGQPLDMGVDDHAAGQSKGGPEHHVGRLSPNPRQTGQSFQVTGDLLVVGLGKPLGHPQQVLRLRPEKAGGADQFRKFGWIRRRQAASIRIAAKQLRRHLVDPSVGTLRREDRRDQQLERVLVNQGALGLGIELLEPAHHPSRLDLGIDARRIASRHSPLVPFLEPCRFAAGPWDCLPDSP